MLVVSLLPIVGRVSRIWSWYKLSLGPLVSKRDVRGLPRALQVELSPAVRVFHGLLFTRAAQRHTKHN
jgi:hypothetical protein